MPNITRDDVLRVAALAHLDLAEDEVALFGGQLARILEYAEIVQQVDTSAIAPAPEASVDGLRWREDVPTSSLPQQAALAAAPDAAGDAGLFRVPKVL